MIISKEQQEKIEKTVLDWYARQVVFNFSGLVEVEFPCCLDSEDLKLQIEKILGCEISITTFAKNQDEWFLNLNPSD